MEHVNDQVKIHILFCLSQREGKKYMNHPLFVAALQKGTPLDWYFPTDHVDLSEEQFITTIRAKGPLIMDLFTNRGTMITPAMVEAALVYCPNLVSINAFRGSRDLYQRVFDTWRSTIRELHLDWFAHPDLVAQIIRECPKLQYIKLLPPKDQEADDLHHLVTMALYDVMPRIKGLYMHKAFLSKSGNHQTSVMLMEALTQKAHQMQFLDLTHLALHFPLAWEQRILDPLFRIVPPDAPLQELCLRNAFVVFHPVTVIGPAPVAINVPIPTLQYYEPLVDTTECLGWIKEALTGPVVDDDSGTLVDPQKDMWRTESFEKQRWPLPKEVDVCTWSHHQNTLKETQCLGLQSIAVFFHVTSLEVLYVDFAMLLLALEQPIPIRCQVRELVIDCTNVIHSSRNWHGLLQRLERVTHRLPSVAKLTFACTYFFHNLAPGLEIMARICPNITSLATMWAILSLPDIPLAWRDQLETIEIQHGMILSDLEVVGFPRVTCMALSCFPRKKIELDMEQCYSFFKRCPCLQRLHVHNVPLLLADVAQNCKIKVFWYKSDSVFYLPYLK